MKKIVLLLTAVMLFATGTAQADIAYTGSIATWNQYGQSGSQTATTGTGSTNITAVDMIRNSGLTANAGGNSLNSSTWTSGGYVQFGFTVDQGYHVNLGSLYFASKVSSTGPNYLEVRTSADNFATAYQTIAQNKTTYTGSATNFNPTNSIIDLSSLAAIAGGNTFYIRFYGTGATSASGTMRVADYYDGSTYYFDSITGTVAADSPTPIPAAAWLLGSGLMGLAGLRRKQS